MGIRIIQSVTSIPLLNRARLARSGCCALINKEYKTMKSPLFLNTSIVKKAVTAICFIFAVATMPSMAATVVVNNDGDEGVDCTLRDALRTLAFPDQNFGCQASGTFGNNDTVNFASNITSVSGISRALQIGNELSINPNGPRITITGTGDSNIFEIIFTTVSLNNLTITGGFAPENDDDANSHEGGGGIDIIESDVNLTNSMVTGNHSADDGGGIFIVNGSTVRIVNSIISGNIADDNGGGIYAVGRGGNVIIEDSEISGNETKGLGINSASGQGGGVAISSGANLTATNTKIIDNKAFKSGGGFSAVFGDVSFVGVTMTGNTASVNDMSQGGLGGGIFVRLAASFSISGGSVISNNEVSGNGGGIHSSSGISITDTVIQNNIARTTGSSSSGEGGGFYYTQSREAATLTRVTVASNTAMKSGGGIFSKGALILNDSVVSDNQAMTDFGGIFLSAIFFDDDEMMFNNVQITNNLSGGETGGLRFDASGNKTLTINDSTISGNTSESRGGGIYATTPNPNPGGGALNINRSLIFENNSSNGEGGGLYLAVLSTSVTSSTFYNNESAGNGGGIYALGLDFSLSNSTVSNNSSIDSSGGGLYVVNQSKVTLTNSSFVNNSANSLRGRGGNIATSGTGEGFTIANTLVIGGTAWFGQDISLAVTTLSFTGMNIVGSDQLTTEQSIDFDPPQDNLIFATSNGTLPAMIDNILSPLADNGGPTLTHALVENSIAIDAADSSICALEPINNVDQRGESRPVGQSCDIGAFEAEKLNKSSFFVLPLSNGKAVIVEL